MLMWGIVSVALLSRPIGSISTPARPFSDPANPGTGLLVNSTSALQLGAETGGSETASTSPNEYPIDPYQLRVPGTTTSLIFSKYGGPVLCESFLTVIAKAQYEIVQAIAAARGDGPVSQPNFEWCQQKLYLRISRPLAREDLTWSMLADTLEGTRLFFAGRGWFETEITILDDTAGPVGRGSIKFW